MVQIEAVMTTIPRRSILRDTFTGKLSAQFHSVAAFSSSIWTAFTQPAANTVGLQASKRLAVFLRLERWLATHIVLCRPSSSGRVKNMPVFNADADILLKFTQQSFVSVMTVGGRIYYEECWKCFPSPDHPPGRQVPPKWHNQTLTLYHDNHVTYYTCCLGGWMDMG